jgi:uracil-DNA glycosylase
MDVKIAPTWKIALKNEFEKTSFYQLKDFLKSEKTQHIVFPPGEKIFEAFNKTPLDRVKVVIIGQDPYHDLEQAHGLCFSVPDGVRFPPSLNNILKELASDLNIKPPKSGDLTSWAEQGVLLLNATLTVRAHQAGSHQNKGWEQFTDSVIQKVSESQAHCVFILWGAFAQKKEALIDANKHLILKAVHPSPLSAHRGFFGCRHFSKANDFLAAHHIQPIHWNLD